MAKLHDIEAQMVEDQGFLGSLRDLIADSDPMVAANAVAVLLEIRESHPNSSLLHLNPKNIDKLLTARMGALNGARFSSRTVRPIIILKIFERLRASVSG